MVSPASHWGWQDCEIHGSKSACTNLEYLPGKQQSVANFNMYQALVFNHSDHRHSPRTGYEPLCHVLAWDLSTACDLPALAESSCIHSEDPLFY